MVVFVNKESLFFVLFGNKYIFLLNIRLIITINYYNKLYITIDSKAEAYEHLKRKFSGSAKQKILKGSNKIWFLRVIRLRKRQESGILFRLRQQNHGKTVE